MERFFIGTTEPLPANSLPANLAPSGNSNAQQVTDSQGNYIPAAQKKPKE